MELFFCRKRTPSKGMKLYGLINLAAAPTPRGVLVAFREAMKYKIVSKHIDNDGRHIILNVLIDNNPIVLVNYYAPNNEAEQVKILEELNRIFDTFDNHEDT